MKRQLKTVVNKLTQYQSPIIKKYLRYYLLKLLYLEKSEKTWLYEGEVIELTHNIVTVSFTWDMITILDNKTNNCFDLTSIDNEENIINLFESAAITMPICYLWHGGSCPYCIEDEEYYTKEAKLTNKDCCKHHRDLTEKELKRG